MINSFTFPISNCRIVSLKPTTYRFCDRAFTSFLWYARSWNRKTSRNRASVSDDSSEVVWLSQYLYDVIKVINRNVCSMHIGSDHPYDTHDLNLRLNLTPEGSFVGKLLSLSFVVAVDDSLSLNCGSFKSTSSPLAITLTCVFN